tara:strand:+ start:57 stop:572 length:516 start_codon:yes stop_codon:yes gene_type:complete
MRYFCFIIIIFIFSCAKQKGVLICGEHKCVNNAEAKQYFEDNLTIEVQIINKNKKISYDLVDLNTKGEKPDIKIFKNKNNRVVKKLSKDEIKAKKIEVKNKKKKTKTKKKFVKKNTILKSNSTIKDTFSDNISDNSIDICQKLDKCDIDSITNYLIKVSNEKDYPNISIRE